jgi:hypothetical protein
MFIVIREKSHPIETPEQRYAAADAMWDAGIRKLPVLVGSPDEAKPNGTNFNANRTLTIASDCEAHNRAFLSDGVPREE